MSDIKRFSQNEMSEDQENQYLNKAYDQHYNEKLKNKYAKILAQKHGVTRESMGTSTNTPLVRKLIILGSSVAAILVFVLFALPIMDNNEALSPQQMASNMSTVVEMDVKRGGQEESQTRLDIKEAFNQEKWDNVIMNYGHIDNLNDEDYYHLGLAHHYAKDYDQAEITFAKITSDEAFKYNAELHWYRGLNLVLANQNDSARVYLEKVARSSWKSEDAKTLLKAIDE